MADYYDITVVATEEPVTLTEAKTWVRRGAVTADDTLLTSLISAVTASDEKYCNRVFVTRTFEGFFDSLCASRYESVPFIQVRRAPIGAISSVEVMSSDSWTAFTDYILKETGGFPRILFPNGITDASPDSDVAYPLKVTFTAGYGAASAVPEDIKTAIKAHIAFLYENRGDTISEGSLGMPLEAKAIYNGKYQIINTFG